jgi:hypothetical protein
MKNRKILVLVIALLIAAAVSGRLYARHSALSFGRRLGQAFSVLGREGFANTVALRDFFSEPEMAGYVNRVRQLSFLGGNYDERLGDLQAGMIYYSEQASLPPEKRFAAPPALKHLTITSSDRSDEGLAAAAGNFILSYASNL